MISSPSNNNQDPLKRTAQEWLDIFHDINQDCKRDEPAVVHAIDGSKDSIEYYADQIWILSGEVMPAEQSLSLSTEMSKLAREQNKVLP